MKSTWRFVLKIIGLSLALAGAVCLVIGFWDKLAEDAVAAKEALCRKRRCFPEFDDYDDDLLND